MTSLLALSPPSPPASSLSFIFSSLASGSSLVFGTSNLDGLRLLGAKVHSASVSQAPGLGGGWGEGADGKCHTAPRGLHAHSSRQSWRQDQGLALGTSGVVLPSIPLVTTFGFFLFPFSSTWLEASQSMLRTEYSRGDGKDRSWSIWVQEP